MIRRTDLPCLVRGVVGWNTTPIYELGLELRRRWAASGQDPDRMDYDDFPIMEFGHLDPDRVYLALRYEREGFVTGTSEVVVVLADGRQGTVPGNCLRRVQIGPAGE